MRVWLAIFLLVGSVADGQTLINPYRYTVAGWPTDYPTNIAGYPAYAFYKDASTYYASQGAGFSSWTNLCLSATNAGAFDLTNRAAGTSLQPTARTAELNGYSGLYFDGGDHLQNDLIDLSTEPYSVAMVVQTTNIGTYAYYMGTNSGSGSMYNLNLKNYANSSKYFGVTVTNTFYVRYDEFTANNSMSLFTNNIAQGAAQNAGSKPLGGFVLFASNARASRANGTVMELVLYKTNLTDTLRSNLFAYWTNKYAITVP